MPANFILRLMQDGRELEQRSLAVIVRLFIYLQD